MKERSLRKTTSISLPIELHERIQRKAKEEGSSPSELIRTSIEIYLNILSDGLAEAKKESIKFYQKKIREAMIDAARSMGGG